MQQYFVDEKLNIGSTGLFDKDQAHHISHVMRMKEGEVVRLVSDEKGYFATVSYDGGTGYVVTGIDDHDPESHVKLTLACALIKRDKWEYMLQKCTELGVSTIVPFETSRTVVKSIDERSQKKQERQKKILEEAAEQCKRNCIPQLYGVMDISELDSVRSELNLVAYEDERIKGLNLKDAWHGEKSVTVVIGPEGGFAKEEIEELMAMGYQPVSLGRRILRAETAAGYVCAVIDALGE